MNLMVNRKVIVGLAQLVLVLFSIEAAATVQTTPQQGSGQPARAVRLSYVDGQVRLAQGNQVLADQAVINTPLLEGMQLTTADNGKAEIQFEDGSVVRVAPDSSLTLQVLRGAGTTADAELNLNSGLAYFEFQGGGQAGQMSVHFGSSVATASGFTVLRVAMDSPPGSVAVFSGNAHVQLGASGGGNSQAADLHDGESLTLDPAVAGQYNVAETIEPNSWDAWNSDRDQALTTEAAAQTGTPSNLGAAQNPAWNDLDANGSWYDVPSQGYVWSPYEAANGDFDPYGNGQWMYTPAYGYLWASGYSWGYLPYQCGAWNFYNGFGWGWAPGVGGCTPWWGLGFYGGPNIGSVPIGYRPIRRPLPPHGPVGPIGHRPIPMIAVNRHTTFENTALPERDKNTQVTIEGSSVIPMRPLPVRPVYSHDEHPSEENRPEPEDTGAGRTNGFVVTPRSSLTTNRPASETETSPSYTPPSRPMPESHSTPAPLYSPPTYTPPRSSSSSEGSSHSSSGSGNSSHSSGSSSGGGGGGSSHSSGGGGGGGGGGSHGGHR